jgi:glycyl-tRNA synthetase beta subunit
MTEDFLMQHFHSILAASDLPQSIKDALSSREPYTLDELDDSYSELLHFLQHKHYYAVLDRIEKGVQYMAQQTDPVIIAKCKKRINELAAELDRLSEGVTA